MANIPEATKEKGEEQTMIKDYSINMPVSIHDVQPYELTDFDHDIQVYSRSYLFIKRTFDILLSAVALILLLPLFAIIALAIKIDSRGTVFFHHNRIGKGGKPFLLHKFRTMHQDADELYLNFSIEQKEEFEKKYKLDNDPRVTRAGKFLRESSLDELPQLINILYGNLSLVGPRPLVEKELAKYGELQTQLLRVKPGLTGHWQVNGRNNITYDQRIKLELYYVQNASVWFDVRILIMTVPAVFRKIGAR